MFAQLLSEQGWAPRLRFGDPWLQVAPEDPEASELEGRRKPQEVGDTLGPWPGLTPERAGSGPSGLFWLPSDSFLGASLPGEQAWLPLGTGPCQPGTSVSRPSRAWFIFLRSA